MFTYLCNVCHREFATCALAESHETAAHGIIFHDDDTISEPRGDWATALR